MFYYKVEYLTEDNELCTETGICNGKTYNDAVKIITEYYPAEELISLTVDIWDDLIPDVDIRESFNIAQKGE